MTMPTSIRSRSRSMGYLNDIREEKDDNGVTVTYACDYLTSNGNQFDDVLIPAYYDLVYPCDIDAVVARDYVASTILKNAATTWALLPDGDACTIPTTINGVWLVQVSSLPDDAFVTELSCQSLLPSDGECCSVVASNMTFTPQGGYDVFKLMAFVAQQLDSAALTSSTNYKTSFIGSEMQVPIDSGKNDLPPPISNVDQPIPPANSGKFTVVGGFVLGGLVAALMGMALVVFRRRRQQERSLDLDVALSKSDLDLHSSNDSEPHINVTVLSDSTAQQRPIEPGQIGSFDVTEESSFQGSSSYKHNSSCYTFDLGHSMKNDVMGTYGRDRHSSAPQGSNGSRYGPTTIEVVPPYPMDETTDSEVDSWAQTDGTVGSLEEHLEEITAEI